MNTHDAAKSCYDLNGAMLHATASHPALMVPLHTYLEELSAPSAHGNGDFRVTLSLGTPQAAPDGARLLYEGPLPEGTPCRLSIDAGTTRWLIIPNRLSLQYSATARQAHMQVTAGSESLVGDSSGIVLLDTALMASQQIMIHGAALRLPQREAAIALLAPSGAGKTTTSLALALQGFGFMTDDAAVLMPIGTASAAGGPRIWGLPRALKVHRRTAELLPQIGGLLGTAWDAEGEQVLLRAALQSVNDVLPPRPVPLAAFIVLGPRVSGRHRLGPVSKSELLVRVAGNNIFCSRYGLLDEDLARYRSIARTIVEVPALELNVGSDLGSLSECVLAALG